MNTIPSNGVSISFSYSYLDPRKAGKSGKANSVKAPEEKKASSQNGAKLELSDFEKDLKSVGDTVTKSRT